MAVCVLHTNKPVSLKDTVYSSTQHSVTVRIQRHLYQHNSNRGENIELCLKCILIANGEQGL